MKTGVTTSVVAHVALLIVAIVGLGSAKPLEPEVVESIAVELVPVAAETNIRAGSLKSTVVETETPAVAEDTKPAELAQPTGNTEENQIAPKETNKATPAPVTNTAPEPVPDPQPVAEPDPVPTPPPDPAPVAAPDPIPVPAADPVPTPVPDPLPTQPQQEIATETAETPAENVAPMPAMRPAQLQKAAPKKVEQPKQDTVKPAETAPKKQETPKKQTTQAKTPSEDSRKADAIDQILNSEDSRGATTGAGGTPTLGKNDGRSATLTQSQLDGLIAKIKGCMSVPPGAAEAGITAQLHFMIDASGNVPGMPEITSSGATPLDRALAGAAQRAIKRCVPYPMAAGQEVQATFDPRELT